MLLRGRRSSRGLLVVTRLSRAACPDSRVSADRTQTLRTRSVSAAAAVAGSRSGRDLAWAQYYTRWICKLTARRRRRFANISVGDIRRITWEAYIPIILLLYCIYRAHQAAKTYFIFPSSSCSIDDKYNTMLFVYIIIITSTLLYESIYCCIDKS